LFFLFFGLTFTVGDDRDALDIDGVAYRIRFEYSITDTYEDYFDAMKNYFSANSLFGDKDIYTTTASFFVSRATSNYHILFLIYAAIFGFFTLKSLKYFTQNKYFSNTVYCFLLFLFFTFNNIFNINGVRFYTAAWVAVFAIFKIIGDKDYRFLALLLITPLIHISFFALVVIFLVVLLSSRYTKVWTALFFVSFLISSFSAGLLESIGGHLPSALGDLVDVYSSVDALQKQEQVVSSTSWYGLVTQFLSNVYPNILMLILILNKKTIYKESEVVPLWCFLLAYVSICNFFSPVPSFGRFTIIAYPLIAYIWLTAFKGKYKNVWVYLFPVFFARSIFVVVTNILIVMPLELLYMSPVYLIIKYVFI